MLKVAGEAFPDGSSYQLFQVCSMASNSAFLKYEWFRTGFQGEQISN